MGTQDIIALLGLWAIVAFVLVIIAMDGQMEACDAVFWPIALTKWLLIQLFLVLFTGWRTQ